MSAMLQCCMICTVLEGVMGPVLTGWLTKKKLLIAAIELAPFKQSGGRLCVHQSTKASLPPSRDMACHSLSVQ